MQSYIRNGMKMKIMSSTLHLIKLEKYVFTFIAKAGKLQQKHSTCLLKY